MTNDFFTNKLPLVKITDIAFKVYKKNFSLILLAGLLIILPFNLILILIPLPSAVDIQTYLLGMTSAADIQNMFDSPEAQKLLGYSYSVFAAVIVFTPLSKAVCAYLSKSYINGVNSEFSGFVDSSISRWGKHIATSIIYNVIIILCSFLIISLSLSAVGMFLGLLILVPAVKYGVGMSFYTVITATQNKWGVEALKESHYILKKQAVATIGFLIIVSLMSYLFSFLFASIFDIFSFIDNRTVLIVINFMGSVIGDTLKMFFQIVTAVWFLNRAELYNLGQGGKPNAM